MKNFSADTQEETPVMSSEGKKLTPRQNDMLTGIVRGLSNKQIAREFDLSEATVKVHVNVEHRAEVALAAQQVLPHCDEQSLIRRRCASSLRRICRAAFSLTRSSSEAYSPSLLS